MSTNFASDAKQFYANLLISNLLENKSNLNKVITRIKEYREIFLDATQLDYKTLLMLSQISV